MPGTGGYFWPVQRPHEATVNRHAPLVSFTGKIKGQSRRRPRLPEASFVLHAEEAKTRRQIVQGAPIKHGSIATRVNVERDLVQGGT